MVWYSLRVGSFNLKYTPLSPIDKKYPYCDIAGNVLKKVAGKFEKGYFINENTGEKSDKAFFLINGKPYAKLDKTKETDNYKEVDKNEVDDLIIEKQYVVECDSLFEEISETGKALKFGISLGGGGAYGSVKVYKAYIHTSELYKGLLFMSLGTTQKSEVIKDIVDSQTQKKKLQEIEVTIMGVDKAKVEDLLVI